MYPVYLSYIALNADGTLVTLPPETQTVEKSLAQNLPKSAQNNELYEGT